MISRRNERSNAMTTNFIDDDIARRKDCRMSSIVDHNHNEFACFLFNKKLNCAQWNTPKYWRRSRLSMINSQRLQKHNVNSLIKLFDPENYHGFSRSCRSLSRSPDRDETPWKRLQPNISVVWHTIVARVVYPCGLWEFLDGLCETKCVAKPYGAWLLSSSFVPGETFRNFSGEC